LDDTWGDPARIAGLPEIAERIRQAVTAQTRILVFGDYDADGVTSTATLLLALRELGAKLCEPAYVIPNRLSQGYSLTATVMPEILAAAPQLMITVDNGIAAGPEIAELMAQGIEVLVSDHHERPTALPDCLWADPRCQDGSPDGDLAGVGVVLKLVQLLLPDAWRQFTDLAAIGTVGDAMDLSGQNRGLVKAGLGLITERPRPALAAILGQGKYATTTPTARDLAFSVCPRLNAAGRMEHARIALETLLAPDAASAAPLVERLEAINQRRRTGTAAIVEAALAMVEQQMEGLPSSPSSPGFSGGSIPPQTVDYPHKEGNDGDDGAPSPSIPPIILVGDGSFQRGLLGLAASKLAETYQRPAIVYTVEAGELNASCRSVGRVDLFALLAQCQELFSRFGGHPMACAFTMGLDALPALRERLAELGGTIPEADFKAAASYDLDLQASSLTAKQVDDLDALEPCGNGNPRPLYRFPAAHLTDVRWVGQDKQHLSCKADGVKAIYFNADQKSGLWQEPIVDLCAELAIDEFRGHKQVQLMVKGLEYPESGLDFAKKALQDSGVKLFDAQRQALAALSHGENTLAVLPTGRGKSLIFQLFAAYLAERRGQVSIFVYPLRALIADQYLALQKLGLRAERLTGESSPAERARVYAELQNPNTNAGHPLAAILTTPEFLQFNAAKLLPDASACARIGFIAIDEAHHLAGASEQQRPAYRHLGEILHPFQAATILACTATADAAAAEQIVGELAITTTLSDDFHRDNLALDDARDHAEAERDQIIAESIRRGEKGIVYVNSRGFAVLLCKRLRKLCPEQGERVVFYHGKLDAAQRTRVADAFHSGEALCVVATSAFGEGMNIPDVRHVFLYHLPFSLIEFNQLAGRAGRDGKPATVHLLFGADDVALNLKLLAQSSPPRELLAQTWRELVEAGRTAKAAGQDCFAVDADRQEQSCLKVFAELGLLEAGAQNGSDPATFQIRLPESVRKVDLAQSSLLAEGAAERARFEGFKDLALSAGPAALLAKINRALRPK
jgi:single-stranded-DNA-specific exonuclease